MMYFRYLEEKEFTEHLFEKDKGFLTYKDMGDYIYLCVMYIEPEYRRQKIGTSLANRLREKYPCVDEWVTEVDATAPNANDSLLAVMSYDFKVKATRDNNIILSRKF